MTDFTNHYKGKTVLITGNTGFKGSWLSLWLTKMGARVVGYALPPAELSHFALLDLDYPFIEGDVRNVEKVIKAFKDHKPDMVIHMAAQPLVRHSYKEPVETFETNVMGTVNILEACRHVSSVHAALLIASDKCYRNNEWIWGYRENDPLGGFDPYSASKAASEIAVAAYRQSFFNIQDYGSRHHTLVASCRAGNIIGGGDWSEDRLIPDMIRAVEAKIPVEIRSPYAVRPWQHILDALHGYLMLGAKLIEGQAEYADAWNFGPPLEDAIKVKDIASIMSEKWEKISFMINTEQSKGLHEASLLTLDSTKAKQILEWQGLWNGTTMFEKTVEWYRAYYEHNRIISEDQLEDYISKKVQHEAPDS